MRSIRPLLFIFLLYAILLVAKPTVAQDPAAQDTIPKYQLETVVVTANRTSDVLASSTATVAVVDGASLKTLPIRHLPDALTRIPGFSFVSLDALGYEPQPTVRGFYGGGEAEYVVLLIDGRPANTMERGLINWNLLAIDEIERIEVVRGGVSSLYGDAALGAVLNVRTKQTSQSSTTASFQTGSYGTLQGNLLHRGKLPGDRTFQLGGSLLNTNGFRDHANRTSSTLRGALTLLTTARHSLELATLHNWRSFEVPGPLLSSLVEEDRTLASPFHNFDETDDYFNQLSLSWTAGITRTMTLEAFVASEWRTQDARITIPLAVNFADTQDRELRSGRGLANIQLTMDDLPGNGRLIVGIDASLGTMTSRYYNVLFGSVIDYAGRTGIGRGVLQSEADASRQAFAAYVQFDAQLLSRLTVSAGSRYDAVRDEFEPASIDDMPPITQNTHEAFSPKLGVNFQYLGTRSNQGNVYANVTRAFKTPTLDQLFDLRTIPIPFPPFQVSLSNESLNPLRGSGYEFGVYHRAEFVPNRWRVEASFAWYHMDMRDELDFDFATFSYVNRSESRHRGIESGLTFYAPSYLSLFANYTYQGVTLETGDFTGSYVKAIPRDTWSAGIQYAPPSRFAASIRLLATDRIYLDDPNTRTLDGWVTIDAQTSYSFRKLTVYVQGYNLFDATYNTTGFTDPAGASPELFLYPASARSIQAGLRLML